MDDPLSELAYAALLAALAGAAIPMGGLAARVERVRPRWLEQELRHSIIAFGGGALISAVVLVLVPEGSIRVSVWMAPLAFGAVPPRGEQTLAGSSPRGWRHSTRNWFLPLPRSLIPQPPCATQDTNE